MPDQADIANDIAARENAQAEAQITRYAGESATHCADCGDPIPEGRRRAIAGCTRCTDCEDIHQRRR